jgi:hypothetical protein
MIPAWSQMSSGCSSQWQLTTISFDLKLGASNAQQKPLTQLFRIHGVTKMRQKSSTWITDLSTLGPIYGHVCITWVMLPEVQRGITYG